MGASTRCDAASTNRQTILLCKLFKASRSCTRLGSAGAARVGFSALVDVTCRCGSGIEAARSSSISPLGFHGTVTVICEGSVTVMTPAQAHIN
jgi:hypothetical protein